MSGELKGTMTITISDRRDIPVEEIIELYKSNKWSSANKPTELYNALINSHSLFSAWDKDRLVGIGNAISDGHLVVYYPHLLVHPDYQGKGIGQMIVERMQEKYGHFHMQMLTADGNAIDFYSKMGFVRAGHTEPMWIYEGDEH
jgi:GNAT superfamily N-acetyltransferase